MMTLFKRSKEAC